MPINAAWHKAHVMPKNAPKEDRIAWHREHAKQCGCRPVPPALLAEVRRRKAKD
jgi:hypothetical protein